MRDSKDDTTGKPGFYPWHSPPCWSFRTVMSLASGCVTLAVTLVQLVKPNADKRVRLFVYHGVLVEAETVGFGSLNDCWVKHA